MLLPIQILKTDFHIQKELVLDNFSLVVALLILLHEKFVQFDWLRAVVFQLNLKYLHVKITNVLRVAA